LLISQDLCACEIEAHRSFARIATDAPGVRLFELVAALDSYSDQQTKYRSAVIPAARTPHAPVLAEPVPKAPSRTDFQGVRPNADDPRTVSRIRPKLTWLEEEIHATAWPLHTAVALGQLPFPADLFLKRREYPIKMIEVSATVHDRIGAPAN
jgi:hypothetical protein